MPPRTSLFEIATRSDHYVCRSCLTALSTSQPPQRFLRGYVRKARPVRGPQLRVRVRTPPREAEAARPEPATTPKSKRTKKSPVRVRYFEKDPETGEVTPVPEYEGDDDDPDEPSFADLAKLTKDTLGKFDVLDKIISKVNKVDGPFERFLEQHGPPGAIEAYRAALKSYDDGSADQQDAPQPVMDIEPDPTAKLEDILGPVNRAILGSKYNDSPELKEALAVIEDAMKDLTRAVEGNSKDDMAAEAESDPVSDDEFQGDIFDLFEGRSESGAGSLGGKTRSSKARDDSKARSSSQAKAAERSSAELRAADTEAQSIVPANETGIWFHQAENMSRLQIKKLERQRNALLRRLAASVEAVGKTHRERKLLDDFTMQGFSAFHHVLIQPNSVVDEKVWRDLWTIFSHKGPSNPTRSARVAFLARVMLQAGGILTNEQQLLAIEANFERKSHVLALDWWKKLVEPVGNLESRTGLAFWELGVKMWCAQGDLRRGERACKALLDRSTSSNPADTRVLLHLIRVYCTKPETAEQGFLLYRRMRDLATQLGKPMEIGDYDDIISLFLVTGHTDYAMFAFTDMMYAGTVNLYGKAKLPSNVRNSFFFGKWLKRLIGAGDLDGAYSVVVFMQKNGVVAAAIQLNGLIGAWLRTGTVGNRNKAYDLAWAMISSREGFVHLRKRGTLLDWPIRLQDNRPHSSTPTDDGELDHGFVPRATVETFIIMATEYRERALFGKLEELFVAFKKCEMPGDAMMMNELLAGAVAQGRGDKARELYRLMAVENDILPTTDTFMLLFAALPVNTARVPIVNNPGLAARSAREARGVFADMMRSAWVYAERRAGGRAAPPLSERQAKLVLHTFRRAHDWAGLSAALAGLRDVLGYRLTRGTVLELLEGVDGLDAPTPRAARAVVRATMALQHLVGEMQHRGQLPRNVTAEGAKDWKVLYTILLTWFYQKMQARSALDGAPALLLRRAKEEMGVAGVDVTTPSDVE